MSAEQEAQAWRDWQAEARRRAFAAADAREAVEAAAEEQERLARIEARHDPAVDSFLTGLTGKPPRTVGSVLADLAAVRDEPWRDPNAELGSERNPVRLDAPPAAERSARTDAPYDDVIRRYHEMGAEVERIIARLRRPRQVRRESGTGWPDITRTCAGDGSENYGAPEISR